MSVVQETKRIPDHPDVHHCKHVARTFLGHAWIGGRCVYCWLRRP